MEHCPAPDDGLVDALAEREMQAFPMEEAEVLRRMESFLEHGNAIKSS
jgi:hypothetical protein